MIVQEAIDIHICLEESNNIVLTRYAIIKTGNRIFNKYAVIVDGHSDRYIYTGNMNACKKVCKSLIAAGMDGVFIFKDTMLSLIAMEHLKKKEK